MLYMRGMIAYFHVPAALLEHRFPVRPDVEHLYYLAKQLKILGGVEAIGVESDVL